VAVFFLIESTELLAGLLSLNSRTELPLGRPYFFNVVFVDIVYHIIECKQCQVHKIIEKIIWAKMLFDFQDQSGFIKLQTKQVGRGVYLRVY
jgi:hypothetical protein